jgi:hypothetical protein
MVMRAWSILKPETLRNTIAPPPGTLPAPPHLLETSRGFRETAIPGQPGRAVRDREPGFAIPPENAGFRAARTGSENTHAWS